MTRHADRLNRYAFERVHGVIDAYIQNQALRPLQRSWRQAQEIIRAQQRACYSEWDG